MRFIKTRDIQLTQQLVQLEKGEHEKPENTQLEKGEHEKPNNSQLEKAGYILSNSSWMSAMAGMGYKKAKKEKMPRSEIELKNANDTNVLKDIDILCDADNINITLVDCDSGNVLASIQKLPCIVGREGVADVVINYDKCISRRHVAFTYENGHFVVIDLQSANGTFINENKISSKCEVKNGDIMQIGQTKVKLIVNNEC